VNSVNKIPIYSFIFRPNISRTDFYVKILLFEELNEINKMYFIFVYNLLLKNVQEISFTYFTR
jgi:hypothetical protein